MTSAIITMVYITDTKNMIKVNNKSKQYRNNKYERKLIKRFLYKNLSVFIFNRSIAKAEDKNISF